MLQVTWPGLLPIALLCCRSSITSIFPNEWPWFVPVTHSVSYLVAIKISRRQLRFPNIKAGGAASTQRRRGLLSIKADSWLRFVGPPVFCESSVTLSSPALQSFTPQVLLLRSLCFVSSGSGLATGRLSWALKALNVCSTSANDRPAWKRDSF